MKIKTGLIFLGIILLTSIGESFYPMFPFIAIGCFASFYLGNIEEQKNK